MASSRRDQPLEGRIEGLHFLGSISQRILIIKGECRGGTKGGKNYAGLLLLDYFTNQFTGKGLIDLVEVTEGLVQEQDAKGFA